MGNFSTVQAALLLRRYFQLESPVTPEQFRHRYRELAFELHPDQSGTDTSEQFREIQEAYEKIRVMSAVFTAIQGKVIRKEITQENIPLIELGLGVGPNVNAVECVKCEGRGFNTKIGKKRVYCDRCDDQGRALQVCPQCKGNKGFTSIDGHHVICWTCEDKGTVPRKPNKRMDRKRSMFHARWGFLGLNDLTDDVCPDCHGTKFREVGDENQQIHFKCTSCDGKGETRIYNPVIPKGRLK